MALVGNIRDFGLSDFLYLVDRGYKTGCLHLAHGDDSASLYFDKGKLIAVERKNGSNKVAEILVRKGKLLPEQARQAYQLQAGDGASSLSRVIADQGFVGARDIQVVLQQYTEESIYALFGWPEGEFRFEQNQRPQLDAPILLTPIQVENLIMEGVRRIDEWGRIKDRIPNTDLVVKFVDQPGEKAKGVNLAPDEWRVFARINGKHTLVEIALKTNLSEFDVCRIVYGFLTAGLVEVQRKPRPGTAGGPEAPRLKRNLVTRIINRIRGM
jgi:hypothetical protein